MNDELKLYAKSKSVRLWQVAEKFGVTDGNFSRKLRKAFSEADSDRFKAYVDDIANEKGAAGE